MPSLSDPCPGKRRRGRHKVIGNLCRVCGARVEGSVDPSIFVALDLAEERFRKACDALDGAFVTPPDPETRLEITIEWRSALQALRTAEGVLQ